MEHERIVTVLLHVLGEPLPGKRGAARRLCFALQHPVLDILDDIFLSVSLLVRCISCV